MALGPQTVRCLGQEPGEGTDPTLVGATQRAATVGYRHQSLRTHGRTGALVLAVSGATKQHKAVLKRYQGPTIIDIKWRLLRAWRQTLQALRNLP